MSKKETTMNLRLSYTIDNEVNQNKELEGCTKSPKMPVV